MENARLAQLAESPFTRLGALLKGVAPAPGLKPLMMQIGVEGVFVGSGIFKSSNPSAMAKAIVKATTHFNDPKIIAEVSSGLGDAMRGLDVRTMPEEEQLATRGW